jgi:hypothetical protein
LKLGVFEILRRRPVGVGVVVLVVLLVGISINSVRFLR